MAQAIWDQGIDPRETLVEKYLQARGLSLPADCTALRYHRDCPRRGDRLPAMIAAMTSAKTNEFVGVHRTCTGRRWGQADVTPNRMMLGAALRRGGQAFGG